MKINGCRLTINIDKIDKRQEMKKIIQKLNQKFTEDPSNINSMHYFCCFIKILTFLLKNEKCVFEKSKLVKELLRCLDIQESINIKQINRFVA